MADFEKIGSLQTWPVEFGRDGLALDPRQAAALADACKQADDVLCISHGWNNDEDEASDLYRKLLGNLGAADPVLSNGRRLIVLRVYWPSKRFADTDLIPGGSAATGDPSQPVVDQIDELIEDVGRPGKLPDDDRRRAALQEMKSLAPDLDQDEQAQEQFVRLTRLLLSPHLNEEEEVLQPDFFEGDPAGMLERLGRPIRAPRLVQGAASIGAAGQADDPPPAAALGNILRGAFNGARNLLNLFTYYEMKDRAAKVGTLGLQPVLRQLTAANPTLRFHLCGHSFGGRLVTATAATANDTGQAALRIGSLTLLQAAFSHNGFGVKFDGQHDGFFRDVMSDKRVDGPIVVTRSSHDWAVGLAYPIASRLRQQTDSAIGGPDDPYGAIGRNGALFLMDGEADPQAPTLLPIGQAYPPFLAGRVYNLEGSAFISSHHVVYGPEVAAALRHAMDRP